MKSLCIAIAVLFISISTTLAQSPDDAPLDAKVEALFTSPRDVLDVKLAVDGMVSPHENTATLKSDIDGMASTIAPMAGSAADSAAKLAALRRFLYEPGPWNDNRPFQYDLDDPLGEKPANRLLRHYLTTRRGNCITMPILFLALGQRLGLTMTLAEAPLHVFVKYTDDDGKVWNLETTSGGGFTRDAWYRQKLPMSDKAVANGIYLRGLSQAEVTALVASFLVEDRVAKGEFETAIAISDVLLRHYPNFVYGLVKQGSAYGALLRRELAGKYERIEDIPADLKIRADEWYKQNKQAFARAEGLGWRPEDGQLQ